MINYSVSSRLNPADKEAAPKWYATAQTTQKMTLDNLAALVATGTTLTRADVHAVIIALVDQVMTALANGASVSLGEIGTFRITLNSEGTPTADEFTAENIKSASVRYWPSQKMKSVVDGLTYNKVASRKVVAAVLRGEISLPSEDEAEE